MDTNGPLPLSVHTHCFLKVVRDLATGVVVQMSVQSRSKILMLVSRPVTGWKRMGNMPLLILHAEKPPEQYATTLRSQLPFKRSAAACRVESGAHCSFGVTVLLRGVPGGSCE